MLGNAITRLSRGLAPRQQALSSPNFPCLSKLVTRMACMLGVSVRRLGWVAVFSVLGAGSLATPAFAQCANPDSTVNLAGQTQGGSGVNFSVAGKCTGIRAGLYQQQNADIGNNFPVSGQGGIATAQGDAGTFTTSKATYKVVLGAGGAGGVTIDNYIVSITTLTPGGTGGADSFTMWYNPNANISTGTYGTATHPFTVNITNLPPPPPVVSAISPTSGPSTGGTLVTITGTELSGVTAVSFGGTAATTFTPISATSLTALSPAGTGTVNVSVTTGGGTSANTAADDFTYTVNSSTQITATSPAGAVGSVDITVTTPGGTSATSASDQFTYVAAPVVSSIAPTSGPGSGGTVVTITGSNFSGATGVSFGGTAATGFTVLSGTSITATSPAGSNRHSRCHGHDRGRYVRNWRRQPVHLYRRAHHHIGIT